jgi:hypothetical protein
MKAIARRPKDIEDIRGLLAAQARWRSAEKGRDTCRAAPFTLVGADLDVTRARTQGREVDL